MSIDVKYECPLGSTCEKVKDDSIIRCSWYVCIRGKDPQSEEYIDQWRCSMAWIPTLLVENAQTNRGQTQAIERLGNDVMNQAPTQMGILKETSKQLDKINKMKQIER